MRRIYLFLQIFWILFFQINFHNLTIAQENKGSKNVSITAVLSGEYKEYKEALEGFKENLTKNNIQFTIHEEINKSNGYFDLKIIDRIKAKRPDLILALGTKAASNLNNYIDNIPIVFSMVLFPHIGNLAVNNKKNITGVTLSIPVITQFTILKEIMPNLRTIGVIYTPGENSDLIKEAQNTAKILNINFIPADVTDEREFPTALQNLIRIVDVIWLIVDNAVNSDESRKYIILEGYKNNTPVMGPGKNYVGAGAAFAVSANYKDIGFQSGNLAVKILNGNNSSYKLYEHPSKVVLYVNERITDWFGIEIPKDNFKWKIEIIK